jgi:hypothetical protein
MTAETQPLPTDAERAEFERRMGGANFKRNADGNYVNEFVQCKWWGWCAHADAVRELGWQATTTYQKSNPFEGLYQDAEGTIPVTAAGQPVGRFVDPLGNVFVQHDPERLPNAVTFGVAIDPNEGEGQAMSTDEIISMARAADPFGDDGRLVSLAMLTPGTLKRFAALVAAKEREACAQVCASEEARALYNFDNDLEANRPFWNGGSQIATSCEASIRARASHDRS